jgi:hypothetical protein
MPELPLLGGLPATGLDLLASEFLITVTNVNVWLSIGLTLLLGAACLVVGTSVARIVGLLRPSAPAGETLAVGLASGLLIVAAWWAAIWSGGRSSFTPVAVGFAIAVALALVGRARDGGFTPCRSKALPNPVAQGGPRPSPLARCVLASGVFVAVVVLIYGSTMAPSPRDGLQPVEFSDEAFYAVLGRDLALTGTENNLSASGFSDLQGVPAQTWYHWGDLWLASAAIEVFGAEPLAARYFLVLPILLLAAAALTGTLVRHFARTNSRNAFLFGFIACLFLAPVPVPGTFFSSWAVGLIFGINLYGLGAVTALLALYLGGSLSNRVSGWALAGFVGSVFVFTLPAHIVIAFLAAVGVATAGAFWLVKPPLRRRRALLLSSIWRRSLAASAVIFAATVAWALVTGHGLGGSASLPAVSAFNPAWQYSVLSTYVGAGVLLAIPIAARLLRKEMPELAVTCLGTVGLLVVGAIAWGARLGDFNMFHVFFGGIAVFATPVAAIAGWVLFQRTRTTQHMRFAFVLTILCSIQLGIGVASATQRLQEFGPRLDHEPIAVSLLLAIKQLPADAKLAYACRPFEEISFTDPSLLSIDAHTGRRIVPMCFEADVFSVLNGSGVTDQFPSSGFAIAPQWTLYPNAEARPSPVEVAAFLKDHGIEYLYVDDQHPSLVADAITVAASGSGAVLRIQ